MPDSYGLTFGGEPVVSVRAMIRSCADHDRPTSHFAGKANGYFCPTGAAPGVGHVLMTGAAVAALKEKGRGGEAAAEHDLVIQAGAGAGGSVPAPVRLRGMVITSDELVTPLPADQAGAVYLVTFADNRIKTGRRPISAAYNLRARNGTEYQAATLENGSPYTWQTMVNAIWAACVGAVTGTAAPTLPYTPQGTPEGFDFYRATSGLSALEHVLTRINCSLVFDPREKRYGIVRGAADRTALAALDKGQTLVWNDLARQWPAADWPEKIRVRFRVTPVPFDGANYYAHEDVALPTPPPAPDVVAANTLVVVDDDLYSLPGNAAARAARAVERAAEYVRRRAAMEYPTVRSYRGAVGSAFDLLGLCVQTVGVIDRGGDAGAALCTELCTVEDFAIARWRAPTFEPICCEDDYPYPYGGSYDIGRGGTSWQYESFLNFECDAASGNIVADHVRYTTTLLIRNGRPFAATGLEVIEENAIIVETECKEVLIDVSVTVECVDGVITTDVTKTFDNVRQVKCGVCE